MNIKNIYYLLKENIIIVIWFVIVFLCYKKTLDFLGETYSDIKTYSDIILILFICLIIFLFIGKIGEKIKNIIKQERRDLIFNYLVLIGFVVYFELLEYGFENLKLYIFILIYFYIFILIYFYIFMLIYFYIFIFPIIFIGEKIKNSKKEAKEKSFFISDKPIEA